MTTEPRHHPRPLFEVNSQPDFQRSLPPNSQALPRRPSRDWRWLGRSAFRFHLRCLPGFLPCLALLGLTWLNALGAVPAPAPAPPAAPASENEPELVPPRPRPDPAQMRERAARITPEERRKFLKELQERRGLAGTNRTEALARRDEFRDLSPQEKAARLRQMRERLNRTGPQFHVLTPAEREAKRAELQQRVQAQVDLLRKRQSESTLTEPETRRLERMEAMAKRLGAGEVLGPRTPAE